MTSAPDKNLNITHGTPCTPGQVLCLTNEYFEAGEGTYEFGDKIYASIIGWLHVTHEPKKELTVISVKRYNEKPAFVSPFVQAIVTCTVISRTLRFARCRITHVGSTQLPEPIRGIIRREYIMDKFRDQAQIHTSFGVGDTVLARVVNIGDGDFILSTAEDKLGVASAVSTAGFYMIPTSWNQMECPRTKEIQFRKVAKILDESSLNEWERTHKEESDTK